MEGNIWHKHYINFAILLHCFLLNLELEALTEVFLGPYQISLMEFLLFLQT